MPPVFTGPRLFLELFGSAVILIAILHAAPCLAAPASRPTATATAAAPQHPHGPN
jgi:hypothetical protein